MFQIRRFAMSTFVALLAVFSAGAAHAQVRDLKVMSFNVWRGGIEVNQGPAKVRDAILRAGADIVAMQESNGLAAQLATELGWYSYQPASSVAVLSRYPITATLGTALHASGVGVRIRLSSSPLQEVIVWSAHLTPYPYGPYEACLDRYSTSRIIRDQERTQLPEVQDILRLMSPYISNANEVPVFLMGDFNTPSHLDWTYATRDLHCGYSIAWPVTVATQNAGLVDAYRKVNPDPRQRPGNTWSPVYKTYVYSPGTPEPQDRIDMVHYAGSGVTVNSAEVFVVGNPAQYPYHTQNEWPSDHAGVLVALTLAPTGGTTPALTLNKTTYARGESIKATFANGPGNSTDWIGIYRAGDPAPGSVSSTAWYYTNNTLYYSGTSGPTAGSVTFSTGSYPTWPLPAGNYKAYFLANNGYGVLAGPVYFTVNP